MERSVCLSLLLFFCFFLSSCEWDSDADNFHDVKEPEDITIGIDLAGVDPLDIIYVYNNTELTYSLDTQKKQILECKFYMNDVELYSNGKTVKLTANKQGYYMHDLKLVVQLKSGTGSLADELGVERYLGEFHFKVKFLSTLTSLSIRQSLEDDKYLKIEWDKPQDITISKYEIYEITSENGNEKLVATVDPSTRYYVDKNYTYGFKQYKVKGLVENSPDGAYVGYHTAEYVSMTADDFTTDIINANTIRITCNNSNPYPVYLKAKNLDSKNVYTASEGNNYIDIPKDIFPMKRQRFEVSLSLDASSNSVAAFDLYCSDKVLEGQPNDVHIDKYRGEVVGLNFKNYYVYDKNMNLSRQENLNYQFSSGSLVRVLGNGMLVVQDLSYKLHVFSNNTASVEQCTILCESVENVKVGKEKIITCDKYTGVVKIYNASTGNLLLTKDLGGGALYTRQVSAYISADDRYIAILNHDTSKDGTNHWYKIYEIDGVNLIERRTASISSTRGLIFSPYDENEIIVLGENNSDFMNILTGEIRKTIQGSVGAIDPVTKNLLYRTSSSGTTYKILDQSLTNELCTFSANSDLWYYALFFNNTILYNEYYTNLETLQKR